MRVSYLKNIHLIILHSLFVIGQINGHGFAGETLISIKYEQENITNYRNGLNAWQQIRQIYEYSAIEHLSVKTYDPINLAFTYRKIKLIGVSNTNCYYRLIFNDYELHDIFCTPSQEFYVLANSAADIDANLANKTGWYPACMLQVGDVLLRDYTTDANPSGYGMAITGIEFIKQSCPVYTLEVEPYHTYLVGSNSILTHNIALESCLLLELSVAFGEGAIAGSQLGSYFGPFTWGAGLCIGGVIGVGALYCYNGSKRTNYSLSFNVNNLDKIAKSKTKKPLINNNSCSNNKEPKKDDHEDNVIIPPVFSKKDKQVSANHAGPNGTYQDAPYHGKYGNDIKGPAPKNGQKALDNSCGYKIKGNTNYERRLAAVDGEYVVLDETGRKEFHGHTRPWDEMDRKMQEKLIEEKIVSRKGRIL